MVNVVSYTFEDYCVQLIMIVSSRTLFFGHSFLSLCSVVTRTLISVSAGLVLFVIVEEHKSLFFLFQLNKL